MKKSCILIACITFGLFGYSQTIHQQVEKQIKDPQRKANAGKADVINANKKNIYDSTTFRNAAEATNNKPVKTTAGKKHCGSKTKQSSKASASKKKA